MLPQGARVTCYPGAPVSYVIPGRACHMLPWAADLRFRAERRANASPRCSAALHALHRQCGAGFWRGPRELPSVDFQTVRRALPRAFASRGIGSSNAHRFCNAMLRGFGKNCCSAARSRRLWKNCCAASAARHPSCEVSSPSSGTAMSTASLVSCGTALRRISRRTICNARSRIS